MIIKLSAACLIAVMLCGCSTAYYKTMETFGVHKRDIMVDKVKDASEAQEEAKEQFKDALEKFASVVTVDGGELQEKYDVLSAQLDRSEARAKAVTDRIAEVEDVSNALFKEWSRELNDYNSESLRRSSERQLIDTQRRYDQLLSAMQRAESKMQPVLVAFRDQVLYLKHNLNARAIASLQGAVVTMESDVAQLVRDMEASIAEANAFIESMEGAG